DRSGSMEAPIDAAHPACAPGCGSGNPCAAGCPTRISELKLALDRLLTGPKQASARWSLTTFPGDLSCAGPAGVDSLFSGSALDDPSELRGAASQVNARIQALVPGGGTPTGQALSFVGNLSALGDPTRRDVVLLLTDGLPNCNASNVNQVCTCDGASCGGCAPTAPVCAAQQARCRCTLGSCAGVRCSEGCLDDSAAVAAVQANAARGIQTIVVGFGSDLVGGDAPAVLEAMARAGGHLRDCASDADCGPLNSCGPTGACVRQYYSASDSAGLEGIFDEIVPDPARLCRFTVSPQPARTELLVVKIDDVRVYPGPDTFSYAAGLITFTGALCHRFLSSSPQQPVNLAVAVVEAL
ncbi:MAG: adventurous gliding motility lipoprotein CglB, partial [Myxococcales bacterium]|nr:adventurous gliding motility lipoprotein CglB [Myxococcales bacterium]